MDAQWILKCVKWKSESCYYYLYLIFKLNKTFIEKGIISSCQLLIKQGTTDLVMADKTPRLTCDICSVSFVTWSRLRQQKDDADHKNPGKGYQKTI